MAELAVVFDFESSQGRYRVHSSPMWGVKSGRHAATAVLFF